MNIMQLVTCHEEIDHCSAAVCVIAEWCDTKGTLYLSWIIGDVFDVRACLEADDCIMVSCQHASPHAGDVARLRVV